MIEEMVELTEGLAETEVQDCNGLVIRPCSVDDVLSPYTAELLAEYAEESKISGMPPINTDYLTYKSFENAGCFKVYGCFQETRLVGFITIMPTKLPHYSALTAIVESIFVMKEHRKGGAGKKLLNSAIAYAKNIGAVGILVSAPAGGVLEKIMPRSGFVKTNVVFFKGLGDE